MVYGIEKFKEYFSDYTGNYVFIGGTACSVLFEDMGADFRATKDLDIVLIMEELNVEFGKKFWEFIEEGKYEHHHKSSGESQFYRFTNPARSGFPIMIELFSREQKSMALNFPTSITPIPIDESIVSLSAILLNEEYYNLLLDGKVVLDEVSVLKLEYVIMFKIRAWLDLTERNKNGESIDSRDIKKHKNDIFRLMMYVDPDIKIDLKSSVYDDVVKFLEQISEENIDLKNIGIRTINMNQLLDRIDRLFICTLR